MKYKIQLLNIKNILIKNNLTISTCESASAGNLSALLTMIDGSSQYYKGSIISYNNSIKENLVKIDHKIIQKYGAISKEVAELMAINTNKIMQTNFCISITGNASKKNLIEQKQSCCYYVAVDFNHKDTYVEYVKLSATKFRRKNQIRIAKKAIDILYKLLIERNNLLENEIGNSNKRRF